MHVVRILRQLIFPWAFAALLPLPMLLAISPTKHADVKCLYLGLASGWLATEVFRLNGLPASRFEWFNKLAALLIAIAVNVSLFVVLGLSVGIQSNIPFAWMAVFAAVPAIGMAPWLSQRIEQQFAAIFAGATMVAVAKLSACVVARFVYGLHYIEQGYVAANWHTAKLMISLFWTFTIVSSLGMLWLSFRTAAIGQTLAIENPPQRRHA
jgi:hypothetical protein